MPSQRFESSLAAGTPLTNVLAGTKWEIMPYPASVIVYAVQDGADAGDLKLDLTLGNVVEIDDSAVPTVASAVGPELDKHRLGGGVAAGHDRIQLKLSNNDAVNASNYRIYVEFLPIPVRRR